LRAKALNEVIVLIGYLCVLAWGLEFGVCGAVVLEESVVGSVGSFNFVRAVL
jgi:hypothetical protein